MQNVILQASGLTKRYGPIIAVDHLDLEVHEGEIFGFLGPNGAGKTTSISMLCGLLKPDSGEVLVRGKPVHSGDAAARARVGVCPQEAILWDKLTCLEQLEFIGEQYGVRRALARQRGGEVLAALGLESKAKALAGKLSGGMRRRLNLALALVHDPEILILDEPEAGLDPQSRVLVREYVRSLARRKTVILTTHNMDEADRLADRVGIIDHGQLQVVDTPEALKQTLGKGDVLEFEVWRTHPASASGDAGDTLAAAQTLVQRILTDVKIIDHTLTVRGHSLLERLPEVMALLRSNGIEADHIQLRANSLEDVFISLTGRRLRE